MTTMTRTQRHQQMAEAGIREHQALTAAHVAGQKPPIVREGSSGKPAIFFTPQSGETMREDGVNWGGSEKHLKELQLYWTRIPDFGITARIYPSETGWVQVLNWSGTGDDGKLHEAQEVDVFTTDENFVVTRFEIHSDAGQWQKLLTFLNYGKPQEAKAANYAALIASQPGSTK